MTQELVFDRGVRVKNWHSLILWTRFIAKEKIANYKKKKIFRLHYFIL